MIVVMLAGTVKEAKEHAKQAGVKKPVIPRSAERLAGLILRDGDLIVEFPSWPEARCRNEVDAALVISIKKAYGQVPRYERIGG